MKRTRKIRNGGNPKYYVCEMKFIPFLNIILINSIMWIKRQWRRFTRLLKCCKYSLLLLPLWLIFSFFVYWGDFCRGQSFSYGNVKKCAVGKYPKSEKLGSAGQAACCACTHSRYFTGGSPSGLRV